MSGIRWDIGWGALLALSFAYFFDDTGLFAACIPAIAVHELGHAAALMYFGARIRKVSIRIYGAKIDYSGILGSRERAISLAAGPAAGAIYSAAAYMMPGSFGKLSAMAGAVMTVFNALPILPLDGGQILACIVDRSKAKKVSALFSVFLFAASLWMLNRYCTAAPLAVSAGLLAINIMPDVRT